MGKSFLHKAIDNKEERSFIDHKNLTSWGVDLNSQVPVGHFIVEIQQHNFLPLLSLCTESKPTRHR